MLIDTMSSHELLQEYRADLNEIRRKTDEFDSSEYLKKYLWKNRKKKRLVIHRHTNTARNNKYLAVFIYEQIGASKYEAWTWNAYHVGLMNTGKGTMMVAFYEDNRQAVKYTPHFFKRYKERLLKVCDWKLRNALNAAKTQESIAAIYIQRNLGTIWVETQSVYKDKMHIFAPVPDGVTLLQWDNKYKTMQANTFITYDMLDEKQVSMIKSAKEYVELNDNEKKNIDSPFFMGK